MSASEFRFLSPDDLAALETIERSAPSEPMQDYIGMFARAKTERKARKEKLRAPARRAKTAERVRKHRTSSKTTNRQRLDTLLKATARASGDRFLEKLIGRERDLVRFLIVLNVARQRFGAGASDRVVAAMFQRTTSEDMTPRQAKNRRHIIEKLEGPKGPWSR